MSNEQITLAIIAVCSCISLICLAAALIKRSSRLVANSIIMLCCPLVGQVFYLGAFITDKLSNRKKRMQYEDIGFSKEKRDRILAPDYDEEIQSVPLEEILLLSRNDEKRKYLLRELKKDVTENYSTLIKALDNDDMETAHYAASAISSAKAEFESNVRTLDSLYSQPGGSNDLELVRRYAEYILRFLKSGILDKMEMRKYSYSFINIMTSIENPEQNLTREDYINIIEENLRVGDYPKAQDWAERAFDLFADEKGYLMLAKVYYYTGQSQALEDVLGRLRRSDLELSSEGLDFVRFFLKRKQTAAS